MKHLLILPCLLVVALAQASSQDADVAAAWNKAVDGGIAFLRKSQSADGSFSGDRNIGITGLVVTGLLNTGKITKDDPMVKRRWSSSKSRSIPKRATWLERAGASRTTSRLST
ncbi:MAG: hypothetical protein QM703_18665 [Gemmatales bacterium]